MLEVFLVAFLRSQHLWFFVCSLLTIWKEIQDTQCFRRSLEQLLWISAMGAITLWTGSCLVWMEQRSSLTLQPLLELSGNTNWLRPLHAFWVSWASELIPGALEALCWGLGTRGITSLFCFRKGIYILLPLEVWATSLLIVPNSRHPAGVLKTNDSLFRLSM